MPMKCCLIYKIIITKIFYEAYKANMVVFNISVVQICKISNKILQEVYGIFDANTQRKSYTICMFLEINIYEC